MDLNYVENYLTNDDMDNEKKRELYSALLIYRSAGLYNLYKELYNLDINEIIEDIEKDLI